MPPLTVIVITYNRLSYTRRTLESLFRTVPNAYFIIYDNNSGDDVKEYLRTLQMSPYKMKLCLASDNVGWGKAVNFCLREVVTEYVLISNNDVEYKDGWYERLVHLYEKYPLIGVLGVWKHIAHGVKQAYDDLVVKDQMPAVGWLFKMSNINRIGQFDEHGPCATRGGNGEDVSYCIRTEQKGMWVCGPKEDVAVHIDGY